MSVFQPPDLATIHPAITPNWLFIWGMPVGLDFALPGPLRSSKNNDAEES
jgi:hypothetical protein